MIHSQFCYVWQQCTAILKECKNKNSWQPENKAIFSFIMSCTLKFFDDHFVTTKQSQKV